MNTSLKIDLEDAMDVMESIKKRLPKMTLAEQIDVAARLKAVEKGCKAVDEAVKTSIKMKLKHKAGEVKGEVFKAVMRIDEPERLNQKLLKEEQPKIVAQYTEVCPTEVITFEPR